MTPFRRMVFVGDHLPRQCGIATFTHGIHRAVAAARPDLDTGTIAMTAPGHRHDYPPCVLFDIREEVVADHARAAEFLSDIDTDLVCLQHEYGIFGGEAGGHIVELLSRLTMPVVTALHTVLAAPAPAQRLPLVPWP